MNHWQDLWCFGGDFVREIEPACDIIRDMDPGKEDALPILK